LIPGVFFVSSFFLLLSFSFNDREIVALSGAHTLGRAHAARSGYDGPWTTKPLRFDNEYYTNLLHRTWRLREWEGPLQFEDEESGTLMMLPSDMALVDDAAMRGVVAEYAEDQELFFKDFALAYAKLLCLGCPEECNPLRAGAAPPGTVALSPAEQQAALFREQAMHGSVYAAKKLLAPGQPPCDVHALEATSGRNALHKSCFWGHADMTKFLLSGCKLRPDVADCYGDTPLHDV